MILNGTVSQLNSLPIGSKLVGPEGLIVSRLTSRKFRLYFEQNDKVDGTADQILCTIDDYLNW